MEQRHRAPSLRVVIDSARTLAQSYAEQEANSAVLQRLSFMVRGPAAAGNTFLRVGRSLERVG